MARLVEFYIPTYRQTSEEKSGRFRIQGKEK
jgi:hypothetical protein